jgi:hypothetical protein
MTTLHICIFITHTKKKKILYINPVTPNNIQRISHGQGRVDGDAQKDLNISISKMLAQKSKKLSK